MGTFAKFETSITYRKYCLTSIMYVTKQHISSSVDARYEDTGEGMNDMQVLSESMQLLVAGHETSSNAISWTLYLLSKHPESIEKIRNEIQEDEEESHQEENEGRDAVRSAREVS